MGTITATTVIDRVATLLTDVTNVRWPRIELLNYLNDGQREIAALKPNAYVKNVSAKLVAGSKQPLTSLTAVSSDFGTAITGGTSDAVSLIDVVRNMSTNGITAGTAITTVSREILDAQIPEWHTTSKETQTTVLHYVYTPLDPKTFYVYPPVKSGANLYVELVYVAAPSNITNEATTITLDDIYMTALMDYMLYRAYSKDIEYAENAEYADRAYQHFSALMQGKTGAEAMSNPNHALAPFNPNIPAGQK